ncbi:recombinase family protein [Sphingomonas sp. G-3-2-10]|uniref:recombinase family protein n=1 Tax=Sphingomonas sp. G-3-2-10 TaxID=2728838 RepID=UPI00146CFB9D|nr:recombinase family protein [Sphingomonas sp. G-3-2-10]
MQIVPVRSKLIPAAQYIRMSTEHQRYSLDNQRAAIAVYAAERGFEIVATYEDSGKSGLTLRGRNALKRLLGDVLGKPQFRAILVLDVGRWGRFQDTDQSAHYEYMCREAGVQVRYCNEQFENDGGPVASILKHMKRVMAAEYSRELSVKVSRAQRQQARLGFKQGGSAPLGLRRQVVDRAGKARMILAPGERKALVCDKVVYVRGPAGEVATVRRIFRMMAEKRMRLGEIADYLNVRRVAHLSGRPWSHNSVRHVLTNQLYIGQYVFGRRYNNLGDRVPSSPSDVVQVEMLEPIVPVELFEAASRRLGATTRVYYSDEQLSEGLSRLLEESGFLSSHAIRACSYLPAPEVIARRYGGLEAAFNSVGFQMPSRRKADAMGRVYTDEDLLGILRRIHFERGFLSGAAIDEDTLAPGRRLYVRRFGSLIEAFGLAGFETTPRAQWDAAALRRRASQDGETRSRRATKHLTKSGMPLSDLELVAFLRRLLAAHGYLSKKLIDSVPSMPSSNYIARRLGGLRAAYAAAGYVSSQSAIMVDAHQRVGRQA